MMDDTGWRPIHTADTDGTSVWVLAQGGCLPPFVCVASYHHSAGWCVHETQEVTHWMPITCLDDVPPAITIREPRATNANVVYVVGSLRNASIIPLAQKLGASCPDTEFFTDWMYPGPEADEWWQKYTTQRGMSYKEALRTFHAQHVFSFDKTHLDRADVGLLVMPCGKSGHCELGYLVGQGKPTIYYMPSEVERYDVMPGQFASEIATTFDELLEAIARV